MNMSEDGIFEFFENSEDSVSKKSGKSLMNMSEDGIFEFFEKSEDSLSKKSLDTVSLDSVSEKSQDGEEDLVVLLDKDAGLNKLLRKAPKLRGEDPLMNLLRQNKRNLFLY